ncbi:MAG: RDD family protein [Acidimicrobiia bacterium]|nr:RDD family protein [Acidimicrobiia bacterium]
MSQGWHSDPFHRFSQRYHDGNDWTEHVSDGSGTSFVDPSGTAQFVAGGVDAPPPAGAGVHVGRTTASPWVRLGAQILDSLIVGIPTSLFTEAAFGPPVEFFETPLPGGGFSYSFEVNPAAMLLSIVIGGAYFVYMVSQHGRTLGKMALGTRIVDADSGAMPSVGAAFLRWIVTYSYVLFIPFIVSAVLIFSDPRRQTLHDKAARTMVVRD